MRVIEISSFGGPDVLRLGDRPVPVAGAGEVLIRVRASGINRPDVLQRAGKYPAPAGASDIPGLEIAGTIDGGDLQAIEQAGLRAALPWLVSLIAAALACLYLPGAWYVPVGATSGLIAAFWLTRGM